MNFVAAWRNAENKILSNVAMKAIVDRLPQRINISLRRFIAFGVYFLLFVAAEMAGLSLLKRPILPMIVTLVLTAFVTAMSVYMVNWCYRYTLEQMETALSAAAVTTALQKDLADWVKWPADRQYQLVTGVSMAAIVLGYFAIANYYVGLPFDIRDSIPLVLLISLIGGQGIHYAIVMPTLNRPNSTT